MAKQEQVLYKCDRCTRFQAVTEKEEGKSFFKEPTGWEEWDNRKGLVKLLCASCLAELMVFLNPTTKRQARG